MDLELWFQEAADALKEMNTDDPFKLRDLYEGHKWEALSKGDRLKLGKFFKNQVEFKKVSGVNYFGKADNNSALYVKMEN